MLPVVTKASGKDLTAFIETSPVTIVGFFDEKDSEHSTIFESVAKASDYVFAITSSAADFKTHDVTAPAIILFKKFDEGNSALGGPFDSEELTSFISANSMPLLDNLGPENYELYVKRKIPIAYFFHGEEDVAPYRAILEPLAKLYKSKLSFVFIDAVKVCKNC